MILTKSRALLKDCQGISIWKSSLETIHVSPLYTSTIEMLTVDRSISLRIVTGMSDLEFRMMPCWPPDTSSLSTVVQERDGSMPGGIQWAARVTSAQMHVGNISSGRCAIDGPTSSSSASPNLKSNANLDESILENKEERRTRLISKPC